MAMQEGVPVTKLRVLLPDGKHVISKVVGLVNASGFPLNLRTNGSLHVELMGEDIPLSFTVQKNKANPGLVAEGRFPAAFTTTDRVADYLARASFPESNLPTNIQPLLRFKVYNPRLRVSLLVRDNPIDNERFQTVQDLEGQMVATSYEGLARQFFEKAGVSVRLDGQGGKEEGLVRDGDAEAAIVVVDRGKTMLDNFLRELGDPIMPRGEVQLVFVYNPELFQDKGSKLLLEQFLDRFPNDVRLSPDLPELSDRAKSPQDSPSGILGAGRGIFDRPRITVV